MLMTKSDIHKIVRPAGRKLCLLFFWCYFFCSGNSQSNNIDTLEVTHGFGIDSTGADRLNAVSKQYWRKKIDSSVYYAQQALQLSLKLNYKKGAAEAYRNMGVTNMFSGDKILAKQYLLKALNLFSAVNDGNGIAATYNNLGVLHTYLSEFSISFNYLDSALVFFRRMADKEGEGSALNYIAINFQAQGNYQKAIDYCLQGFEIRKQINDHEGVVFSLINVGNMYLEVGQAETALNFYNQSVSYAQAHNMKPFNYSLNQIGKTYLKLKQYDKAESYLVRKINGKEMQISDHLAAGELYSAIGKFDSAIMQFKISLAEGNSNTKALSLMGLSKAALKQEAYELAMSYAKQAYGIAESLQNKLTQADIANVLAELYKINGEYKKAIRYFEFAHSITDSVTGENYQRKLAFTESKNEIENEQAHVRLLSTEKELQAQKLKDEEFLKKFIIILFAFAVIIAFLIIRNINGKRKKIQSQKDQIEFERAKVEKAYEELQATQSQLIQSEKMASLGELTAGIAHEIQNPLNFVNNFSEVSNELLDEMKTELASGNQQLATEIAEDVKQNLEKILHHGKRAESIVKGMLQHSRISTGQKESTDINALADECLRLSYHGLRAKDKSFNAEMKTDFDESIGKINIVQQDIGRVLLNMINNAFYAVSERRKVEGVGYKPSVSVSTKKLSDKIEMRIKDNGNGIPQKIVDKIFQPFFTTKPTGQGTGLGLSLSYDIVKAHGGEIKVETKENEGSEFIIQLPITT